MKPELSHLDEQIRSVDALIKNTEIDFKHIGWVATRRINFIGANFMLQLASKSHEIVSLTPLSQKGLFKQHDGPVVRDKDSCLFTLKRKHSPDSVVHSRRKVESSSSQVTLVDMIENFSRVSLNEEDRISNSSFHTALEEQYEMTDVSDEGESDEGEEKHVPGWAQDAEAAWVRGTGRWAPESVFKLPRMDLTEHLQDIFGKKQSRKRKSSGQW